MNDMVEHNIFDVKVVLEMKNKGDTTEFLFITPPSNCNVEAFGLIFANDDFTCEIFEGVTTSSDGLPSDNLAINVNRISGNGHTMKIYATPVVTNYGKRIWITRTWSSREPSGIYNNYSIMPLPATKYIWKITKNSMGTHFIDIDFWWKEIYGTII